MIPEKLIDYVHKEYTQKMDTNSETGEQGDNWSWSDTKDMIEDIVRKLEFYKSYVDTRGGWSN